MHLVKPCTYFLFFIAKEDILKNYIYNIYYEKKTRE